MDPASCAAMLVGGSDVREMRSVIVRAFIAWLLIFVFEVLHGTARTLWLVPLVGDLPARQIGVAIGSLLILMVTALTVRWIGARSVPPSLRVGVLWLVLMLVAEVLLGRLVFGYPWSRIAEDFNPSQGGILGFGMLVLVAPPWLAGRWR